MSNPYRKFRDGNIEVTIWKNDSNGKDRVSFTLQRSYCDKSGTWHQNNINFYQRELSRMIMLLHEAYDEIILKENEAAA